MGLGGGVYCLYRPQHHPAYTATQFALFTSRRRMPASGQYRHWLSGGCAGLDAVFLDYALCCWPSGMLLLYKVAPWETIRPHKRRTPQAIRADAWSAAYRQNRARTSRPAPSGRPAEGAADARIIVAMSPGVELTSRCSTDSVWAASSMSCCWPPGRRGFDQRAGLVFQIQRMLEDRRAALPEHGASGRWRTELYDRLVRDGSLPLASAQAQARPPSVNALRRQSIFISSTCTRAWCNTRSNPNSTPGHQPDPRPDGKPLFIAMRDVVSSQGHGFVEYQWPQPGQSAPVPKLAYAELCPMGLGGGHGLIPGRPQRRVPPRCHDVCRQIVGLSLLLAGWWC